MRCERPDNGGFTGAALVIEGVDSGRRVQGSEGLLIRRVAKPTVAGVRMRQPATVLVEWLGAAS